LYLIAHNDARTHSVGILRTGDQTGYITQHTQETDIHGPGGIRTRNPSKRTAADIRFRPRAHRDRLIEILFVKISLSDITLLNVKNKNPVIPNSDFAIYQTQSHLSYCCHLA